MSHFGRSGPPDIKDTYSLLVLNISFRTTTDDLYPLFDQYRKVIDVFIPRDRRTGDSRGFAFVRYKYADEAQKAVDRLDGKFFITLLLQNTFTGICYTAADGLVNRGNTFKEIGRVTEAIQDYIRAVNIRPTMPEAHANLASAYKDR
ncbi:hypothetical protein ZIOFF_008873 [Zingiber officinale]|uniref:RRM domain-containing protein n=1 Tax=Zingiber officinale TaxID=94328 RepID=A0A8J5LU24_ZINOF|nr:hypothetical protein ZIOFF_008873 [Zingiber officinale]